MKRSIFMPLFMVVALIAFMGCREVGNNIVKFKGGSLTAEDLDAHYEKMKRNPMFSDKPEQFTPEFVFDHALNMEMIIAKGLDEKLHLDPRVRAEIHEFMSDLFLQIMQENLVPKINKEDFTKEELTQFYNDHRDNYTDKELYSVKMIKLQSSESAGEVIEKLQAGLCDFKQAAAEYSMDEKSKNSGGNIGQRALSKFQKEWQPVISSLEIDQVSGPHKVGDDYYVFKLTNKTEPFQYSFEEKEPYVKNDLMYMKYKKAWQSAYDELKKEFKVETDEKKLAAFIDKRSK